MSVVPCCPVYLPRDAPLLSSAPRVARCWISSSGPAPTRSFFQSRGALQLSGPPMGRGGGKEEGEVRRFVEYHVLGGGCTCSIHAVHSWFVWHRRCKWLEDLVTCMDAAHPSSVCGEPLLLLLACGQSRQQDGL